VTRLQANHLSFVRTIYLGQDTETQAMITAIQIADKSGELTAEQKAALRQVYIRIIWADNWHINFHPDANSKRYQFQPHPTDHPAGHVPALLRK